jgi:hypothetical protein
MGKYRRKGRGEKKSKVDTEVKCGDGEKKKVAYTREKGEESSPGPGEKIAKYPR